MIKCGDGTFVTWSECGVATSGGETYVLMGNLLVCEGGISAMDVRDIRHAVDIVCRMHGGRDND